MKKAEVIAKFEEGYKVYVLFAGYCDEVEDVEDIEDAYADFVYKVKVDEEEKEISLFVDTDEWLKSLAEKQGFFIVIKLVVTNAKVRTPRNFTKQIILFFA